MFSRNGSLIMQKEREKFLLFRIRRNGDERAFGELYDAYEERMHRYLLYKLPQGADAEDLVTEIFLRVWSYIKNAQVDQFSALLYRVARNLIAEYYQRRSRQLEQAPMEEGMDVADENPDQEETLTLEMSVENVKLCLPKLKDEYRDVLIMRYLDELSVREVSLALEKSENAVRITTHRALKAIRRMLDAKESETYDATELNHQELESTSE